MIIRCRITCRDFESILEMHPFLKRIYVGNDRYSVEERSFDLTCQEEDLDAVRQIVTRFDRHARLEIWKLKGELAPVNMTEQPPRKNDVIVIGLLVQDDLPKNFLGHPFIKTSGKRPEA